MQIFVDCMKTNEQQLKINYCHYWFNKLEVCKVIRIILKEASSLAVRNTYVILNTSALDGHSGAAVPMLNIFCILELLLLPIYGADK